MKIRDHKFQCVECEVNVTCCDCNIYHSVCCMCTYIHKLKDSGQKPIKAYIKDRGTHVWGKL